MNALGFPTFIYAIAMPHDINYSLSYDLQSSKILNLLDDYEKNALSIKKGTLNDDERNKINEHVSITYELLKEIPFPKNLSNVPIIASYHHEKLDGTGYPFGKKGTDLSVQSRILAFSDIFEALIDIALLTSPSIEPQFFRKLLSASIN